MDLTQRLKDKVAVITGGASGIGLATAKRMQAEGAIIVIGDVDPAAGKTVADDMNVTFVQVDVSDQVAVDQLFDTAVEVHGGVDIAFNNAGISPPEDDLIENTGIDAWQRVQDINLKSVFFCCKAALRHMVPARRRRGSPPPRRRAACWRCPESSVCSTRARESGSTRCAPAR